MNDREKIFALTEPAKKCEICGTELTQFSPCKACAAILEELIDEGYHVRFWSLDSISWILFWAGILAMWIYASILEWHEWTKPPQGRSVGIERR
jgi:hypothetical protein